MRIYSYLIGIVLACLLGLLVFSLQRAELEPFSHQPIEHDHNTHDLLHAFMHNPQEAIVCYRQDHRNIYVGLMVMSLSAVALALYAYLQKMRYSRQLLFRQEEILQQRDQLAQAHGQLQQQRLELERQRDRLEASMRYASRLQQAMLPSAMLLEEVLSARQQFLHFAPKDLVSGDFYWAASMQDRKVLLAADCTGHGVPGALMATLGLSLFKDSMPELEQGDVDTLLQRVEVGLQASITQSGSYADGMECALVLLDEREHTLTYAVCGHPAYLYRQASGELEVLQSRKGGLGLLPLKPQEQLGHRVSYAPGDMLFLCSDGVQDQFGGEEDRKFSSRRLRALMQQMGPLPVEQQEMLFLQQLRDWQKDNRQTDDQLFWALRLE